MAAWIVTTVLWLLASYCFAAAIYARLPMPRWVAAFNPPPGPSILMSAVSRIVLGVTLLIFGCGPPSAAVPARPV